MGKDQVHFADPQGFLSYSRQQRMDHFRIILIFDTNCIILNAFPLCMFYIIMLWIMSYICILSWLSELRCWLKDVEFRFLWRRAQFLIKCGHIDPHCVSNHRLPECLFSNFVRAHIKETSKVRITGPL